MALKLSWNDPNFDANQEDGVRVYRSAAPMNPGALPPPLVTLPADAVEYVDPVEDGGFYYRIGVFRGSEEAVSAETYVNPGAFAVTPELNLDFALGVYQVAGVATTLGALGATFTGGQQGTYFDASGVMQVAGVDEMRFDHDPVTLAPRGLLFEGFQYNYIGPSEDLTHTNYTKTGGSITANAATSLRGAATADLFTEDSSTGVHEITCVPSGSTGNQTWVNSVFVKANGRTKVRLHTEGTNTQVAEFDLSALTGAMISGSGYPIIEDFGNGWRRIALIANPGGAGVSHTLRLRLIDGVGATSYTGDGSSGIYVWGFQSENRQNLTSYIPSTGINDTYRRPDLLTIPTANFSHDAAVGTWAADFKIRGPSTSLVATLLRVDDGTANYTNVFELRASWLYPLDEGCTVYTVAGGTLQSNEYTLGEDNTLPAYDGSESPTQKACFSYQADEIELVVNGSQGAIDDLATMPASPSRIVIGSNATGGLDLGGPVERIRYWPQVTTTADKQSITA